MPEQPQETLYRNLRFLQLVPRRGVAVHFVSTRCTRDDIAKVLRRLRNEQRGK